MRNDCYNSSRNLQRELEYRMDNADFTGKNMELFKMFADKLMKDDIKDVTRRDHLKNLRILSPHIDFTMDDADISDVKSLVARINNDDITRQDGEPYAAWSKKDLRATIKKFYRLICYEDDPRARCFNTHPKKHEKPELQPIDIPDYDDIQKLATLISDTYKPVLMFHWSAGLRIKELMNIHIDGIRRYKGYFWIDVPPGEKTGPRSLPLLKHSDELKTLIDHAEDYSDGLLLHNKHDNVMKYNSYEQEFRKAAEYVETPAILTPKMLRKSRATNMAGRDDVNVPKLQKYFGWRDIKTAEFYIKLSESCLEDLCVQPTRTLPQMQQTAQTTEEAPAPEELYA